MFSMFDKYKQKNTRFQMERQIAEDGLRDRELADHATDAEPPKNAFDAFMKRAGWGILVILVVLAVFGKVFWNVYQGMQTPKMLNIAGEMFVCDKKADAPEDILYEGVVGSAVDRDLFPSGDGRTNVEEWVGQAYAVTADAVLVYDGKCWYSLHSGDQSLRGFLGEFFTPNRFHRFDTFRQEIADGGPGQQDAIDHYHVRLVPYLTEQALLEMEMGRQLARFDQYCKDTFGQIRFPLQIEVTQSSLQENAYNFSVTIENVSRTVTKTFTGSYIEGDGGKVDSFTVVYP